MHYNVQFGRTILRGVGSRVALGAYDEIKNNKFLPLMKKALRGTEGTDAKTSLSLVIKKMAPLLSIMPQRHTFFLRAILAPLKWNLPLIKKNPGHASDCTFHSVLSLYCNKGAYTTHSAKTNTKQGQKLSIRTKVKVVIK